MLSLCTAASIDTPSAQLPVALGLQIVVEADGNVTWPPVRIKAEMSGGNGGGFGSPDQDCIVAAFVLAAIEATGWHGR